MLLTLCSTLHAQDSSAGRGRLEQFKLEKLKRALKLDHETYRRFHEKYEAFQVRINSANKTVMETTIELETALSKNEKEEIARLTQLLIAKRRELHALQEEKLESLKTVLSSEQFAKFLVFEVRFFSEIQKMLWKKESQRRGF